MNEIMVFDNPEFGDVRTVMKDGEPWFVAADVCNALQIANPSDAMSRLDDDEKETTLVSTEGNRGNPNMTIVNEPGLYSLVIGSRKPEAKAFKRWITHEVIPSIRKQGIYATDDTIEKILDDPDFGISLLTRLKDERQRRAALEAKLEADKPYTEFAQSIANSSDSVYVGDFAKLACNSGINIGRNQLFRWMWESGYIAESNRPYQSYVDQGLFEVQEYCAHTAYGDLNGFTAMITGKGQMVLMEALRKVV